MLSNTIFYVNHLYFLFTSINNEVPVLLKKWCWKKIIRIEPIFTQFTPHVLYNLSQYFNIRIYWENLSLFFSNNLPKYEFIIFFTNWGSSVFYCFENCFFCPLQFNTNKTFSPEIKTIHIINKCFCKTFAQILKILTIFRWHSRKKLLNFDVYQQYTF